MDWNGNSTLPFVPRSDDSSLSFLYNYTQYPGGEVMKQQVALGETAPEAIMGKMECGNYERKKRLTSDQLDSLESSFQKEIKLDPERKMKLSKELGLQPRQIAVWFQNRRARWKTKQLENLYDSLKHEFEVMSREKHKLQEEVVKLKAMLRDQACRTNLSAGNNNNNNNNNNYTELSTGEETVESTSAEAALRCCNNTTMGTTIHHHHQQQQQNNNIAEGNCSVTMQDYNNNNTVPVLPYWAGVPYYP